MKFSIIQWSGIFCCLLISLTLISQSSNQIGWDITSNFLDNLSQKYASDKGVLSSQKDNKATKKTLKYSESFPPPTAGQLLTDVNVSTTSPSANDIFKYKFRYRYASTTENGTNAQIQFTFPSAYEIVETAALGGNIASITDNGNQYTVSLASPASLGLPSGTLAAGASGLFEFKVRIKCGTNGSGGIPSAGTSVNLTQNPIFTVTGVSNTASSPASVTVPTVSTCPNNTPTSSGTSQFQKRAFNGAGQGRKILFGLYVPKNTTTTHTYTDIFPSGFKIHGGLEGTLSPGWVMEIQANGSWWNISNFQNVANFIGNVSVGSTLKDQNGTNIPNTMRVSTTLPNGNYAPAVLDYAEGVTGIRVTGSGNHADYYLRMYIHPSTPIGWTQNCWTTTNPAYSSDCVDLYVDNRGSLKPFCFFENGPRGLGGTDLSDRSGTGIDLPTDYPNLYKDPMDVQGNIVIDNIVDLTPVEAPTIELLLPLGFDFVEGTTKPNYWFANDAYGNIINNPPSAFDPTFTRIPDYNGTGRILLIWDFPSLTFPVGGTAGETPRLALVFSARYMGTHPLPNSSSVEFNTTIKAKSVFTDQQGLPTQSMTCTSHAGIPSSGGSVNSEKYVKGALDTEQSRFPTSGNTTVAGDATYELFVYNHNFENIKQIDIADILPYIGDKDMLGSTSRGSGWSEELANAITVERYKIGSGLIDASSKIPNGVLYSNTYNACYLDGALPSGQVTAIPASANTGQSGGCTDFSSSVSPVGAKGFAFRWTDTGDPLAFGEYLKITVDVTQLNGEADKTNNEVAWNSFAYTAVEADNDVLFSSEPLKVGVKMIDMSSKAAFGGKVWHDSNGDGRQDSGEPAIQGVTVHLYDAAGNPITETATVNGVSSTNPITTTTDVLGDYYFYGLQPNTNYSVRLENDLDFVGNGALSGLTLTTPNASGISDAADSDGTAGTLSGSPATARPQITLSTSGAGTTIVYNDFGFYKLVNVGNYVWLDDDAEGDQDTDESPVQGVVMQLYKAANNTLVASATTNSGGFYLIENIPPGTYYIKASSLPASKVVTTKNGTGNTDNDSDFNSGTDVVTDNFVVASGESRSDIDLGLKTQIANPATICGQVWDDFDEDGVKDSGEPGLNNITVNLLDANNFVINTTQTIDGGQYCFYNLTPNTNYRVAFVLPSVTASSFTNSGADMDANTTTGITGVYTPSSNQTINNVDCGIIGGFSIGNLVWSDVNQNGIRDASESAYSNVEVYLLNGTGTNYLAQTTTDLYGRYVFKNLVQGAYRVEIELPIYARSSNDPANANSPNAADNDDNGIGTGTSGRVQSPTINLQQGGGASSGANWSEADHGEIINGEYDPTSNPKAYYTVDFGLIPTPPPPPVSCTGIDSDSDGITNNCDDDDDNDGILDIDECPQPVSSGLTGHITNFTTNISSTNPASSSVPHTLNSITYSGTTYSDFILPDAFQSFYTLTNNGGPRFTENGVSSVFDYNSPTYDQDIIQAYQSRNLNAYQSLDNNNFADGDYYELSYNNPIIATAGGFLAVTERLGNNPQVIQALDINGNIVGNTLTVQTAHYVDLGHNVFYGGGTQNCNMALYPIEDLAPLGTSIYGLRISFGSTATGDGPDAKVFFFGDLALTQCDFDGDGIPNNLDLDSDNDGCPDAIEGGGSFVNSNLQNDRLTGGVDGNGIPTVANGGQAIGSSQNVSSNACCTIGLDTDSDGISDICDLDDDNDGILDEEESCSPVPVDFSTMTPLTPSSTSQTFTQNINGDALSSNLTVSAPYVVSGSPSDFSVNVTGLSAAEAIKFIDENGATVGDAFGAQITFNSPEQVYISADNTVSGSRLTLLDNFTFTPTGSVTNNFQWIVISSANATITNSGNFITVEGVTSGSNQPFAEFVIVPNEPIDGIEIIYENNGNTSLNTGVFNFSYCDTDEDNDGLVNRLDLDSDDDGCPDAIEGNGNISAANLINNRIGGSLDANGVPVLANGGQGAGASYDAAVIIGCDEICDDGMDNDGDGLIDCADSDCAPILSEVAVTQPTCANKTGGQIVITASSSSALEYSITNEPNWQNSNTFSNLGVGQYTVRVRNTSGCTTEYTSNPVILDFETCLEICDDGIDNDGDGLVDCDDPDCKNFGNTNIINND